MLYKCINVAGEKLTKLIKSLLDLNIVFASLNTNRIYLGFPKNTQSLKTSFADNNKHKQKDENYKTLDIFLPVFQKRFLEILM